MARPGGQVRDEISPGSLNTSWPNPLALQWRLGIALLFGALSTLAHGPIHAWWFAPWCIAGWILLIQPHQPLGNMAVGLAFGMGWFTAGLWCIAKGLFTFTAAGAFGAVGVTMLLVIYLSCYPAIAGMLIGTILYSAPWPARWILVAASWTTTAWLRGTLFGGFPPVSVGTGQLTGPLSGWAPVGGSLLVEFTALFVAAALADVISACTRSPWNHRQVSAAILSIGVLIVAGLYLKTVAWTQPMGNLTVRLAQGNLPQHEKFTVEGLRRAGQVYGAAIGESDARLTILPETAFPMTWESLPEELRRNLRRIGSEQGTAVMLGALMQEPSGSTTNSLLLIRSDTRPDTLSDTIDPGYDDRYVKRHLVFIGEHLPQSLSWLGQRLNVAYSSLSPGDGPIHSLNVEPARMAPTICFESYFGGAIAIQARNANLLVNVSNFAWFTGTWAGDLDLDDIRMRSLETGRWTARVANTGITAFVDEKGAVIDALPQDVSAVLDGRVELHAGLTPYVETGDQPTIAICGICLTVSVALRIARSRVATR